jgi:hypothetical protein
MSYGCVYATGPCTQNNGGCSQLCLPGATGVTRTCQCVTGYTSPDGGVTCVTSYLPAPFLLVIDLCLGGLYQINTVSGITRALPVSRQVAPVALAFDNITSTIFWSDVTLYAIRSLSLSTGGAENTMPFVMPGEHKNNDCN